MAAKKDNEDKVQTTETTETVKVTGTVEREEVTPPPAQPEPEKAASDPTGDEEAVANIGHLRVRTAAEKRIENELGGKEDHNLRDAKEAHADAARISIMVTVGTEGQVSDLKGIDPEGAAMVVRTRLLFDWLDGQGVAHLRGKEMDLPRNEAAKLVEQGLAERADPPALPLVETAVAEAQMKVLSQKA